MGDILRCSMKSLLRKRLRTSLTAGSVAIGVMMVVIVTMISDAGRTAVNTELESLGISGLSISTNGSLADGQPGISPESLEIIRETREVADAMPLVIRYASSRLRDIRANTLICGIDAGAKQAISLNVKYGRMVSKGDVSAADYVCVVDETLAKEAYGRENIIGKTISLRMAGTNEEFRIVGIAETGSSLLQNVGELIPSMVYIPYSTMQSLTGNNHFDQVAVRVSDKADVFKAQENIMERLQRNTGLEDFFRADNLSLQRDRLGGLLDIVILVLTVISGISLVVAGLGIMTILMVSVNERMREIGIKKSIGASNRRILAEFLLEAVVISLLGSVVGIAVGGALSLFGMYYFGLLAPIRWTDFLFLIGFAVSVGGIFGVYPAMKGLPP